jgi:hypothetical protein
MTRCPIAVAAGPAFRICPLKGVIGDYQPPTIRRRRHGTEEAGLLRFGQGRQPVGPAGRSAAPAERVRPDYSCRTLMLRVWMR